MQHIAICPAVRFVRMKTRHDRRAEPPLKRRQDSASVETVNRRGPACEGKLRGRLSKTKPAQIVHRAVETDRPTRRCGIRLCKVVSQSKVSERLISGKLQRYFESNRRNSCGKKARYALHYYSTSDNYMYCPKITQDLDDTSAQSWLKRFRAMVLTLKGIGTTTGEPFADERILERGKVLRIGRAIENDWVLVDPTCQVSKRHCALSHEGGQFIITDLSTNGVFVDDESTPVGCGALRPLMNGQTLQIGVYRFAVSVDTGEATIDVAPPRSEASVSSILYGSAPDVSAGLVGSLRRSHADWLASVPAGGFDRAHATRPLGWDAPPEFGTLAVDTRAAPEFEQSQLADYSEHAAAVQAVVRLPDSRQTLPSDWNAPVATSRPEGEWNVSVLRPVGQATDHLGARQRLVAAFLDGAGLPGDALDAMNQEIAFREAGRMLRVAVEGTAKLLNCAALFETEFAIVQKTGHAAGSNALRSSTDAASTLQSLIGPPRPGSASGAATMLESFAQITTHEMALVAAIGDVLSRMAVELDPAAIRARSESEHRSLLASRRKAHCWDAFEAGYEALRSDLPSSQSMAEVSTHLLAGAYAQQLREI
jgi:type VI secretion system protein